MFYTFLLLSNRILLSICHHRSSLTVIVISDDERVAVGSECRRSSGYWHSALRPHNAGAPCTTLATKVATVAHRSLSGNSASYLADDCRFVADARERRLRSTESRACVVTWTHSTFGGRAFAAAGPGLWNSLPPHLRDAGLPYSRFRQSLETYYFCLESVWGHGAVRTIFNCAV